MSARQTQDSVAKDGSPILGLPRSRKGAWRRGRLDLTGGDLFLHDGNVRWRRRAVSDGNPRSPARSPSCRDCAFLPVVRYRCLCRDRCRLSVTPSARRCVFDWWRVAAMNEAAAVTRRLIDGLLEGGSGRVIPDLPTATLPSDRSPKKDASVVSKTILPAASRLALSARRRFKSRWCPGPATCPVMKIGTCLTAAG